MASPEEVSGSHALTTAEQLFCTLTAWHERVSVYVIGAGIANLAGAKCNVYAINGSQRTLLATGKVQGNGANEQVMMSANQGSVAGQGDTIALYVQNPYGVTAAVKIYMVGWDPTAAVTPVESSSVQGVTLTLNEQTVGDLAGGYVNLNTSFNPNGDPLSVGCRLRLYALLGGADRVLMNEREVSQQESATTQAFSWLQNFAAGANEFVMTAQGRLGNSAVTVTGVLAGTTGSAGAGGGGGTLAGDVTGPIGSNIAVKLTGAAGVLAVAASAAVFTWAAGAVAPGIRQPPALSDVAPQDITIRAQDAFAGAAVHTTGGNIWIEAGLGAGASPPSGNINFSVDGGATAALQVQGSGSVAATGAISSPEFVVVSASRTPTIESAVGVPAPSLNQPGSLVLSNGFNPLYVQNPSSVLNAIPQLDSSGFLTFDPATVGAGVGQAQSVTGAGNSLRFISQPAETGSITSAGDMSFILGADDPPGQYPTNPKLFWFGTQMKLGGVEPGTGITGSYNNVAILKWLPGGVANLLLAGGYDDTGGGAAGAEISCFREISIATETDSPINNIIAGVGPTSTFLEITNGDATDQAAWSLAYFANHPTSGDVAGVQILYTETAIGSGQARYLDIQKAGTRMFDIRPNPGLTGAILHSPGYLYIDGSSAVQLSSTTQVLFVAPQAELSNANAFGWTFPMNTSDIAIQALTQVTSVTIGFADASSAGAVGKLALHGQNNTGAGPGGTCEIGPGTGTTHGVLAIVNTGTVTTIGANGGASALTVLPVGYLPVTIGGTAYQIPFYNHA